MPEVDDLVIIDLVVGVVVHRRSARALLRFLTGVEAVESVSVHPQEQRVQVRGHHLDASALLRHLHEAGYEARQWPTPK